MTRVYSPRPEYIPGPVGTQLQRQAKASDLSTQAVRTNPIANMVPVAVTLTSTHTNVPHGLGRAWTHYVIGDLTANAVVYAGTQTNASKYITLTTTAACMCTVWIV